MSAGQLLITPLNNYGLLVCSSYVLEGRDFRLHREFRGVSLEEHGSNLPWFAVHGTEDLAPRSGISMEHIPSGADGATDVS